MSNEAVRTRPLPVWAALVLSGAGGFLSLTQEMIWFRLAGVGFRDEPTVFGYVLGWMLLGLAIGAWLAPWLMVRTRWTAPTLVAASFAASALVGFLSVAAVARIFTYSVDLGQTSLHLLVALVALVNGVAFPLLCHAGAGESDNAARSVGWFYFANVIGSTLAPLLTGYLLFELWGLEGLVLAVALGFLAAAALTLALAGASTRMLIALGIGVVVLVALHPAAHARTYERLEHTTDFNTDGHRYRRVVETHSGVIATTAASPDDVISGGGVYDGRLNTGLEHDSNGIFRAYVAGALVENPTDVLVIGLSGGSWARVLANHEGVKSMTIVEINGGYLDIIKDYPESATLLTDPRVKIVIDDGRRWLIRNSEQRFDLIMMNTTMHWRANATSLLSIEFLELAKKHLKPGGVIYFNTTMATDAIHTAGVAFPYRWMVYNFVAASDQPLEVEQSVRRARLRRTMQGGESYFDKPDRAKLIEPLLAWFKQPPAFEPGRLVTDDNMITEYGYRRLESNWFSLAHHLFTELRAEGRWSGQRQPKQIQ